jgi:STAS-like domain of unknown function (DUF4325)
MVAAVGSPSMEISIGADFSNAPAGRNRADGPFSGEAFREDVLLPSLKLRDNIKVILDGPEGYGSSFLEEAFGGIIRNYEYTSDVLKSRLELISVDGALVNEVWSYIDDASKQKYSGRSC